MGKIIDLSGQRFGRLLVLEYDKESSLLYNKTYFKCLCDCGTIKSIPSSSLKRGDTQSCGCLRKELFIIRSSKSNRIEFDSDQKCLRVYFNNHDEYFLCDVEDRDIVEKHCWSRHINKGNLYVKTTSEYGNPNKKSLFHRLVMEKYYGDISGLIIDHINHNTLDNRKENLRVCTYGENNRNRIPLSNTGEKFISYDKHSDRYIVFCTGDNNANFKLYEDALLYKNNYCNDHPDVFRYNSENDVNKCIVPFVDTDNNDIGGIITPFMILMKDRFNY